jgi:heme exporter protein C
MSSVLPPFRWSYFAAAPRFYALCGRLVPWCFGVAAVLALYGLYIGLGVAPTDFQQGESYRIIFIHVPTAWMAMLLYVAMAFWCAVGLTFNARLAFMLAQAIAPTGAFMAFLALWTGAVWGKPTWGTWWVWDARLTSTLILLFLYIGYMSLRAAIEDERRADRASALLAIVGVVNVPIIYFSVKWWNTLHQGASVSVTKGSSMAAVMLEAMLVMVFAAWAYCFAVVFSRVRTIILERERGAAWTHEHLPQVRTQVAA